MAFGLGTWVHKERRRVYDRRGGGASVEQYSAQSLSLIFTMVSLHKLLET